MEELMSMYGQQSFKTLKYGDVIEGRIMQVGKDELLVDIGAKSEGIVPSNELSDLSPAEFAELKEGDEILVSVVTPEDNEGHAVLSLNRARQEKSWRKLQRQFDAGEIINTEISGYNKGGLLVNLEGVRGFVPSSQVTGLGGSEQAKQADLQSMVGRTIGLKIIEINRNRNRLILSERLALSAQREVMKERLLSELKPGDTRHGRVVSIADFGAFVDIGGADGLVHLSELSWSRVNHPSEVLKVGQEVDVYVLGVDERDRKIALSLKRTQQEPWMDITSRYQVGQLVEGTITQLATFGAFARIADGVEGLIHVSELSEGRIMHPRDAVKEGDHLTLRIIRIDPQRKRIGLSLKRAVEGASMDDIMAEGQPGEARGERGPRPERSGEFRPERGGERGDRSGGDR
ncbi:MAG: 30S ribosomal protein S1, partial [Candidatus Chloroheliales bacterium]